MAKKGLSAPQIVFGVIGAVIGLAVALNFVTGGSIFRSTSVERKLELMAQELNAGLPKQIDAITRWDRVEAGPGKTCSYIYTINANLTDAQKEQLKTTVTKKLHESPDLKVFFDNGVTIWYKYLDAKGISVFEFPVS